MNLLIDKLVELLSDPPAVLASAARIGARRPSAPAEVPAIAVSLNLEKGATVGIGRLIRSGESVAQSTSVIEVDAAFENFSGDLKSLRLQPLPLKRNPSSRQKKFTENDIRVRNVTDPANPTDYRLVEKPSRKEEFRIDAPAGQIIFGEPQSEGEKLEVVHWTVVWRDEILGERYSGSMTLEIWANSSSEVEEISRRLQARLRANGDALRRRGFIRIRPLILEPAESALHQPPVGSPFLVWKQKLGYGVVFESQEGGETSAGARIERIDVEMDELLGESLSLP